MGLDSTLSALGGIGRTRVADAPAPDGLLIALVGAFTARLRDAVVGAFGIISDASAGIAREKK